jgi:aryl-alcohol dehydrogenase-like predicted oxidoreductase
MLKGKDQVMKKTIKHLDKSVSALGLGCWAIGGPFWSGDEPHGWGDVDDDESIRAIHRALDLGISLLDTANVYGAGHSERVLAKALEGRRKDVVIVTKFNAVFDEETRQVTGSDATPGGIRQACEASLRRLNTDYIDVYLFHDNGFPPEKARPVRDTLDELVTTGKIRTYGWSTDFPQSAAFFADGKHCSTIEVELNVLNDNVAVLDVCEENSLTALNRGPLAMGILSGKYKTGSDLAINDVRGKKSPEWMKYFKDGKPNPEFLKKMDAVREILTSNGRTLAQGAIAWLWARSDANIPIPGFRTVKQVEENAKAMDHGPLTAFQMTEIAGLLR